MKNKWIVIFILIAILFINPSKNHSMLSFIENENIKPTNIKKIDVDSDYVSSIYDESIAYYDGLNLKSINSKGEEVFKLNIRSNKYLMGSNKYIDILDKENSTVYSINKNGKIVFKKSIPKNGIVYKSLKDDLYIYVYKKEDKNRLSIYDNEYNLINDIEFNGSITDVELFNNYIYVVELNTRETLNSEIYKYDYNGNLKKKKKIDKSVVIDINKNKENITIIKNNSIGEIDSNLEIKKDIGIENIKYYSDVYEDSRYIIEEDDDVINIKDKKKRLNLNEIVAKGIVNKGDRSFIYTDKSIYTIKNREIKNYKEDIIKIDNIKDDIYAVNLNKYIDIIKLK